MNRGHVRKSIEKMRLLRSQGLYTHADKIKSSLVKLGAPIEILRDGSVLWWHKKKGGYTGGQLLSDAQSAALTGLLDRTYRHRKPLFLGKMTIAPDYSYKSKEQLMNILLGGIQ